MTKSELGVQSIVTSTGKTPGLSIPKVEQELPLRPRATGYLWERVFHGSSPGWAPFGIQEDRLLPQNGFNMRMDKTHRAVIRGAQIRRKLESQKHRTLGMTATDRVLDCITNQKKLNYTVGK